MTRSSLICPRVFSAQLSVGIDQLGESVFTAEVTEFKVERDAPLVIGTETVDLLGPFPNKMG